MYHENGTYWNGTYTYCEQDVELSITIRHVFVTYHEPAFTVYCVHFPVDCASTVAVQCAKNGH